LEQAAHRLGISTTSVRRMIDQRLIPASQVVECAPWQIPVEALEAVAVRQAASNIKSRLRIPQTQNGSEQPVLFSES